VKRVQTTDYLRVPLLKVWILEGLKAMLSELLEASLRFGLALLYVPEGHRWRGFVL
jgi:hypothetical protein